MYKPR